MKYVAVLMTVYNRKNVTIKGLRLLDNAINQLGNKYCFDIFMTDDGSTDGTSISVSEEFPNVHIIYGDGDLYWSGGMRKAWQAAIDSGVKYDYYLWYNDDIELYESALVTMVETVKSFGNDTIVCGAFRDKNNQISYGGKDQKGHFISPGSNDLVYYLNGNLVLIPNDIFQFLGNIDEKYIHGLGDFDYGLRAIESNKNVKMSCSFVGACERHDTDYFKYLDRNISLINRIKILYDYKHNPGIKFYFDKKHFGFFKALNRYILVHIYTLFPTLKHKKIR